MPQVLPAQQAHKEKQAHRETAELKVHKVLPVLQANSEPQVPLDHRGHKVPRAYKASRGRRVHRARKVFKVRQAHKVRQVFKGRPGHKGRRVLRVLRVFKE